MVAGLTIRERVRSLDIWLGLGVVATPYVKRSGTLHWRFTVGIQLVESQGLAPEDAVEQRDVRNILLAFKSGPYQGCRDEERLHFYLHFQNLTIYLYVRLLGSFCVCAVHARMLMHMCASLCMMSPLSAKNKNPFA